MIKSSLPPRTEMLQALWHKDPSYEGLFVAGIRSTGIFCRPTCPARKPKAENVEFFANARDALLSGYRACKRCRPLDDHADRPPWLKGLLQVVDARLHERWTDHALRELGVDPVAARRWFQKHHGMTFHAYVRARKLGNAMKQMQTGKDVLQTGLDLGYESESGFRDAFTAFFDSPPGAAARDARRVVHVAGLSTPLGAMIAGVLGDALCLLEFGDRRMLKTQCLRVERFFNARLVPEPHPVIDAVSGELDAYFAGTLRRFTVPLAVRGTAFQEKVWGALQRIPYGETWSYSRLAKAVGTPGGQRAVGRANGDNRLAIIIPCHRVIREDGTLSGYGGGVWRKQALLDHERGKNR